MSERSVRQRLLHRQPMVQFGDENANLLREELEDVLCPDLRGAGIVARGPASGRHRLHGDDRQSAIRLDFVCEPDRPEIPLGPRGDPGSLHYLCINRDLARPGRGLVGRSFRAKDRGPGRRRSGRHLVGDKFARGRTVDPLHRSGDWRHRRRRGLAAGLTAAGFGAGSALTIIPIQGMIQSSGYEATFLWFGIGQGVVVVVLSLLLRAPQPGEAPASTRVQQSARDYTPLEVLASPIFWVMYVMFVLVGAGGLMATAQLAPIATDFQVAKIPVSLLGLTLPALTFALSIDRVLNGLTRPF